MKKFFVVIFFTFVLETNQAIGAEVGMPQLNPEFWASQIFWLILIFSVLYLVTWKTFLPKITDSIENRKSKVIKDLNETQKLKENAEKKLNEYNKIIENTKKEAKNIIENNKKKLEIDLNKKKQKFNEEIDKELTEAENQIKNLRKNSISSINKIAVEISKELVKKMVGSEVNMSSVTALVEDASKKKMSEYK